MVVTPLNGTATHPLSAHALAELKDIAARPVPSCAVNAGVTNRLLREQLVEVVDLPSPFKTHRGRHTAHLQATAAGHARLAAESQTESHRQRSGGGETGQAS